MKIYTPIVVKTMIALSLIAIPLWGTEVEIRTHQGDNFIIDVEPEDTMSGFLTQLQQLVEVPENAASLVIEGYVAAADDSQSTNNQKFYLDVAVSEPYAYIAGTKKSKGDMRNYHVGVSKDEKKNISYIVTTLANKSLVKILSLKSSLKKAGDKVGHVHPLRFLMCIFTDEELKVGIHNISNRGWVWGDFLKGIGGSLTEETNKNNLKPEYIVDFAQKVGIDPNLIIPSINERRWEDFVKTLINTIPRQGDPNRYDM